MNQRTRTQQHTHSQKQVWGKSIKDVLAGKRIGPDIQFHSNQANDTLDFIHRSTGEEEIYFLRNVRNAVFDGVVQFRVTGLQPELWDPETGEIISMPWYFISDTDTRVPLSLTEFGSCFIVFRKGTMKPSLNITFNKKAVLDLNDLHPHMIYSTNGMFTTTSGNWSIVTNGKSRVQNITIPGSLDLNNGWVLKFDQENGNVPVDTMPSLIPLNKSLKEKVKYYSGTVSYYRSFQLAKEHFQKDRRMFLQLGKVREIAEVYLNGKRIGLTWHSPFALDITDAAKEGENFLVIETVNTINNMLVGNGKLPVENRHTKSNITKLPNAWRQPFAEAPLIDAGLIGPVQLQFAQVVYK